MPAPRRKTPTAPDLDLLADRLLKAQNGRGKSTFGPLPSSVDIAALCEHFLAAFFPGTSRTFACGGTQTGSPRQQLADVLAALAVRLEEAVFLGLHRRCAARSTDDKCRARATEITSRVLTGLPDVQAVLAKDVQAALDGDPAATGADEVIACYPGLYAIATYRAGHLLLGEGAEIIPRMLTEHAKSRTGIDIHPGARIGPSFFIDHGTGIVLGETTEIGRGVRIYQGVTLGALSIKRRDDVDDDTWRDKRHPTIEDEVIIYANATILGGATVIGRGAVIGGNAFLTYSVPPGTRVGVGR